MHFTGLITTLSKPLLACIELHPVLRRMPWLLPQAAPCIWGSCCLRKYSWSDEFLVSWMHRIHNVTTLSGGGAVGGGWTVPGEESLMEEQCSGQRGGAVGGGMRNTGAGAVSTLEDRCVLHLGAV